MGILDQQFKASVKYLSVYYVQFDPFMILSFQLKFGMQLSSKIN